MWHQEPYHLLTHLEVRSEKERLEAVKGWQGTTARTGFQRASCRSLMRLKPVVKTLPSARKMALMGGLLHVLSPSPG